MGWFGTIYGRRLMRSLGVLRGTFDRLLLLFLGALCVSVVDLKSLQPFMLSVNVTHLGIAEGTLAKGWRDRVISVVIIDEGSGLVAWESVSWRSEIWMERQVAHWRFSAGACSVCSWRSWWGIDFRGRM